MPNIPDSVSFKQLANMLAAAPCPDNSTDAQVLEAQVSSAWTQRVEALLKEVEQSSEQASAGKTTEQVMALGSFRTHLWLGLQALKASTI